VWGGKDHRPIFTVKASYEYLRRPRSDLLWRKVRDAEHLHSDKPFNRIEMRDLSAALTHFSVANVYPQSIRRLSSFGKRLGSDDGAHAKVDRFEIFPCDHGGELPEVCRMMQTVLVIGGGVAGVSAAISAARTGSRVVLVEERPYLGGRARSFVDRTTGDVIDNGQHLMMGCYTSFLAMAKELGAEHHFIKQPALRVRFVDADGSSDLLDAGVLPGKLGVALGILRLRKIPLRDRLASLRFAVRLQMRRVHTVGLTCKQLLTNERQTPLMVHRFWEPIVLATLNARLEEADASLLTTVLSMAFFGGAEASKLYLPSHGLSVFTDALPGWLAERGGSVQLSTSADSLVWDGERVISVTLSSGQQLDVDRVVVAIPPKPLQRLLEASPGIAYRPPNLAYSPIVSVYLWYDREWMADDFVAMLGTNIQWVFNRRSLTQAPEEVVHAFPGHVALTVSAGDHLVDMPGEEIVALCERELRAAFTAMQGVTLVHSQVIKERQATLLATPEANALRPCHLKIGNITFAGDWTQTGLPATLEGAARSGEQL